MKYELFYCLFLQVLLLSCKTSNSVLIRKELKNSHETTSIDIPKGNPKITQSISPHGAAFEISYKNGSLLFYNNDKGLASPNVDCYGSIGFYPPVGKTIADTVIEGSQNGKYWKELFRNGYSIGYKNINGKQKDLFDKSLSTFRTQ